MKRKRSPSPRLGNATGLATRPWNSASPPSSRSARSARNGTAPSPSPPALAGGSACAASGSGVRKSGRRRKLNYESFNSDWMTEASMVRFRSPKKENKKEWTEKKPKQDQEEEEEDESSSHEEPAERSNGEMSEGSRRSRRRSHSRPRSGGEGNDDAAAEGEGAAPAAPATEGRKYSLSPMRTPKSPERRKLDESVSDGGHNLRRRPKEDYFHQHVRFSPSVKPGSPALSSKSGGGSSRLREGSRKLRLRKVRLHNLTSEDEQSEFQRRYSRDLRTRRKQARNEVDDEDSEEDHLDMFKPKEAEDSDDEDSHTRKSSRRLTQMNVRPRISSTEEEDDDENDRHEEEENGNGELNGEDALNSSSLRRSSRRTLHAASTPMMPAAADQRMTRRAPSARSTRIQENGIKEEDDDEEEEEEELEDEGTPARRRSGRITKPVVPVNDGGSESQGEEDDEEEDDEDDRPLAAEPEEQGQQGIRRSSRRCRIPVDRLSYDAPLRSTRGEREVRNLDQYSSEEEFRGENRRGIRRSRYNMRENRQTIRRFEEEYPMKSSSTREEGSRSRKDLTYRGGRDRQRSRRDRPPRYKDRDTSSSSSAGDNSDEDRFQKRKTKRMNVERSKLMPLNLGKDDVSKAIFRDRQKVGASLADVSPMEMDMNVSFDNVGGCASHVNSLKEMVMFPLLYPEIFQKFSINAPRGVLFYGPPGTGKTMIARALACECSRDGKKVAFFMRKGADCLSKWIGESERQLRLLFDQAYLMRPSIIFFDEIDGLAPVRSSRQDQIHSSIVSTLLALMDGLDCRGEVIVIGATNRIENIDPALRRPGRFDRELRFDLPTRDARKEILSLQTNTWKPALPDGLIDSLADKTIGYCGADLKGLCAESALNALRRRYPQVYQSNQKLQLDMDEILIRDDDFFKAMKTMVPSTHRVSDQNQSPLPPTLRPLLQANVSQICQSVTRVMPCITPPAEATASAAVTVERYSFRPRLLITGEREQALTTYIAPAVLHYLEKLPCHKLDIPALYSNSVRTPEEALVHILHEAKRTIPSVLYLPHAERLWKIMSESVRETFLSLLSDVQPSAHLLVLAVMEDTYPKEDADFDDLPQHLFLAAHGEVISVGNPSEQERKRYFEPIFEKALKPVEIKAAAEGNSEESLAVVPVKECRSLTEKEEKRLRKKEGHLLRELRIFLRDIWAKINREQKFFMFRVPVDTEEVYDYLDMVTQPMDFDTMLSKLDNNEYNTASGFLDDIDLISENAIAYNSDLNFETNKIICHRARALQDFCYALVKAEMDTDFEENCQEIVERRKKLTKKLKETEEQPKKKAAKKRRVSSWAKGCDSSSRSRRAAARKKNGDEENGEEDEDGGEEEECEDEEEEEEPMEVNGEEEKEEEKKEEEVVTNGTRKSNSPPTPTSRRTGRGSLRQSGGIADSYVVPAEVNGGVRVDQARLTQLLNELVRATGGQPTERLERLFAALRDIVETYATKVDRSALPTDLKSKIDEIKTAKNQNGT